MPFMPENSIDRTNLILDLIAKKQQALGANLTNVNTPNYERQDVDFGQYLSAAGSPLETKLAQTLGPSPFVNNKGGRVNVSNELIQMQKNMLFYSIATRKMSSEIQNLKAVLQVGK